MGIFNNEADNSGLTQNYNNEASGHSSLFHWSHLALMVTGMAFPMVISAAPALGSATALDVVVQAGHSIIVMLENTFEYTVPVIESVWDNAMEGNFAPSTWEVGDMMPSMDTMNNNFDEWLRNAEASGELPYALEDSENAGLNLRDWMMNEYDHEGH